MRNVIFLIFLGLGFLPGQTQVNNKSEGNSAMIQDGRIFFGHQSVGQNVLQGVQENASSAGEQAPQRVQFPNPVPEQGGFLTDAWIGTNGDPASKCAAFLKDVQTFPRGGLDLAMMKFCYTDFSAQTDVRGVFNLYRRTVDSLRETRPGLVIVHSTVPLTARTPGWKRFVKWVLGRGEGSDGDNIKRNEYNDLIREAYKNEPLFDLAALESTLSDGSRSSFTWEGKTIFTLADQYTDDGGHLNRAGRSAVATAFVRVLSEALTAKKHAASNF